MSDQFPTYDVTLKQRGRRWTWSVWTTEGKAVMSGVETNRPAASYKANSALFLLLRSSPYWVRCSGHAERSGARLRR